MEKWRKDLLWYFGVDPSVVVASSRRSPQPELVGLGDEKSYIIGFADTEEIEVGLWTKECGYLRASVLDGVVSSEDWSEMLRG